EKWNSAEGASGSGSLGGGSVERAEEERAEHAPLEPAAVGHALLVLSKQKGAIAVQPTLRLEKGEKEKARRGEQRELTALFVTCDGARARDPANRLLEHAIKPRRERVAPENLDHTRMNDEVTVAGRGGECAQRLGVAVDDMCTIDDECGNARWTSIAGPGGNRDASGRRLYGEHEPEDMRCSRGQSRGEPGKQRREHGLALYEQVKRAERTRTCSDACLEHRSSEAESRECTGVERRRFSFEADRGGDWGERAERIGGCEKLSGGAEREHAPRVARTSPRTATSSLRAASFARARNC